MKLILLQKVQNLGALGDTVNVKPGYGRNFLVPQGKAVPATAANVADASANHVYDDGPELGWQLAAADVAVASSSSSRTTRTRPSACCVRRRPAPAPRPAPPGGAGSARPP